MAPALQRRSMWRQMALISSLLVATQPPCRQSSQLRCEAAPWSLYLALPTPQMRLPWQVTRLPAGILRLMRWLHSSGLVL